ncbi:uncharacterized protein LOC131042432 isoform X2 [Cryptomeria japonica]|uniref:uncharacterized protein LOC131042432 isoform X2 n=1 Tax=Cryptomeria japonica TaxID=3369 RepID=UPI0025AD2FC1|nr:uncharacterized protein LOC131042432 isoform X2 [Cryptomeria japonica]
MEFPFSKQPPTMQAGGSSVRKNVSPIPNSNPKAFEIFERRGGVEASPQGLRHFNAIDLGGSGDIKRDLRPSTMNFGQGIPAGDNASLNGVESEMMLSLDEILDDLHKKVVSVDVNEFGVRGNSANPLGFGSGNPIGEGSVASLPQRNEQQRSVHVGIPNRHEGEVAGPLPVLPATGNQIRCTVPGPSITGEKYKDVIRSEVEGVNLAGDVACLQGNRQQDQAANFRGSSEQRQEEDAAVQGIIESSKGGASGSLETNDQSKGEVTEVVVINDQSKGQTSASVGTPNQSISQAAGSEDIHDQDKGKMLAQSDKALGPVIGGALEPILSTPRRGRQISRKFTEIIQSPDWLPEGWFTELKTRETGSSAGTKDKYFYDPVSQRRFRSKAEVFSFLETGKIGRYKPKAKSEGEVGRKRKVSSGIFQNAASFDPNIRPTKVRWVLNDSEGSWIPFINEDDLNGFNSKEGECTFDLNSNSADAWGNNSLKGQTLVNKP